MRDLALYAHIILGSALIVFPILIMFYLKKSPSLSKFLSALSAGISWFLLVPAGKLYITFYPATKTLITAGANPWMHEIVMETKEHWGLLLPIIATLAAGLVFTGKQDQSRKWWILLAVLAAAIGIMGRIITGGAAA